MIKPIFKKVDYDLNTLTQLIGLGEIGLPGIQRPFVWSNTKVRDLFDSMYKGYPVGYLLFWQNGLSDARPIGTDKKQKPARLVIVDGQQRLTSLYAVVKDEPVLRENYEREHIRIAFNPLERRFEVADAAIRRDKAFISNISCLWSSSTGLFEVTEKYLQELKASREVSDEEEKGVQSSISTLYSLLSFPFTTLELGEANISDEDIADVFVRINSKGTSLNQADFILTLMSVFWDEGRTELERFCRVASKPTKEVSPFNHFIEPAPDQLLRVGVNVAFKRARLRYVYSILRGKDLETGQFSDERRATQFDKLKKAQTCALDVQYWHDFMRCLRMAGFRSKKMIIAENTLLFSYALYLIGRTEYGVDEPVLRKVIAQWYFMSAITGRFTGSPETKMEFDLAQLRHTTQADEFVRKLERVCATALTNDFWKVTLPNDLATSSPRSPSLFAYNAALVLLDAPALFSTAKLTDLLDPAIKAKRSAVERHHLFPKSYLKTLNISGVRETNQIANYAYVEWGDNLKVSNQAPAEYLPELKKRFSGKNLERMYHYHALPEDWENMEYQKFLEKRRDLMAQVVFEGYQELMAGSEPEVELEALDLSEIIDSGESESVEFKSTLRLNLHTGKMDKEIELSALKTLAGFLNTSGGTLIIGVSDDGVPVGIGTDKFTSEDKMSLHLVNIVTNRMGAKAMTIMQVHFEDYDDSRVMVIKCQKSSSPVFVKDEKAERFYVRAGPSTAELSVKEATEFIEQRFK